MTVIEHLFDGLYDRETMQGYLSSFLKDDSQLDTYLQRCLDRKHFHAHYFQGMKDVSQHVYRLDNDFETNQEIDSFISSLESGKPPHQSEVPERLKEESLMMDKLMNFYMAFVGGLWTGRGDSFGLRLFKKPLVDEMMTLFTDTHLQKEALQYYG